MMLSAKIAQAILGATSDRRQWSEPPDDRFRGNSLSFTFFVSGGFTLKLDQPSVETQCSQACAGAKHTIRLCFS